MNINTVCNMWCLFIFASMLSFHCVLPYFSPSPCQMEGGLQAEPESASPLKHHRCRPQSQGLDSESCQSLRPLAWVWPLLLYPLRGKREREKRREFGCVDAASVDFKKPLNRSSYITAVNQRWSGGGNIWQMKMRARLSPPIEKDPSSLLCTMRLSMCSMTGEGSELGLSRGSSSCRRHSTCCWD